MGLESMSKNIKHKVYISEQKRAALKMTRRLWLIKLKSCLFHVQLQYVTPFFRVGCMSGGHCLGHI